MDVVIAIVLFLLFTSLCITKVIRDEKKVAEATKKEEHTEEEKEKNELKRAEMLELANTGNAEDQYNLGVAYLYGHYDFPWGSKMEAQKWIKNAADQGFPAAMEKLAEMREEEEKRAAEVENRKRMENLAASGDAEAQFKLGMAYQNGEHGFCKNPRDAIKWIKLSAEQGFASAVQELERQAESELKEKFADFHSDSKYDRTAGVTILEDLARELIKNGYVIGTPVKGSNNGKWGMVSIFPANSTYTKSQSWGASHYGSSANSSLGFIAFAVDRFGVSVPELHLRNAHLELQKTSMIRFQEGNRYHAISVSHVQGNAFIPMLIASQVAETDIPDWIKVCADVLKRGYGPVRCDNDWSNLICPPGEFLVSV